YEAANDDRDLERRRSARVDREEPQMPVAGREAHRRRRDRTAGREHERVRIRSAVDEVRLVSLGDARLAGAGPRGRTRLERAAWNEHVARLVAPRREGLYDRRVADGGRAGREQAGLRCRSEE